MKWTSQSVSYIPTFTKTIPNSTVFESEFIFPITDTMSFAFVSDEMLPIEIPMRTTFVVEDVLNFHPTSD